MPSIDVAAQRRLVGLVENTLAHRERQRRQRAQLSDDGSTAASSAATGVNLGDVSSIAPRDERRGDRRRGAWPEVERFDVEQGAVAGADGQLGERAVIGRLRPRAVRGHARV
jgi:hypothetical protein